MNAIFNDPRSALVPARLLVRDRYNANAAAALRVPALWFRIHALVIETHSSVVAPQSAATSDAPPEAYALINSPKTIVSLETHLGDHDMAIALVAQRSAALSRWLDDLSVSPLAPNP
jgi:hypothetical protein